MSHVSQLSELIQFNHAGRFLERSTNQKSLCSFKEPFLRAAMRHFGRRGYTPSPGSTPKSSSSVRRSLNRSRSEHWETGDHKDVKLFKLVDLFLKSLIQ